MNAENAFEPKHVFAIASDVAALLNYTARGSAPAALRSVEELTDDQRQIVSDRLQELSRVYAPGSGG